MTIRCLVPFAAPIVMALSALGLVSCGSGAGPRADATPEQTPVVVRVSQTEPLDLPGVHNVLEVTDGVISGSVPEGDAGFDSLKSMGVKTIVCVDAAVPDVERAEARGMRYVHIPTGYDGIDDDDAFELAAAVRDLPRPIFVHCHHGKHRGPAAAAMGAIGAGEMTNEQGGAYLKLAGTSPHYTGLYQCVALAPIFEETTFERREVAFVSQAQVTGLEGAMAALDRCFGHLQSVQKAGWKVPAEHPDLVPIEEASRLTDLLRVAHDDPEAKAKDETFRDLMDAAVRLATELEDGMLAEERPAELDLRIEALSKSCKDCHNHYRDY